MRQYDRRVRMIAVRQRWGVKKIEAVHDRVRMIAMRQYDRRMRMIDMRQHDRVRMIAMRQKWGVKEKKLSKIE